MTYRLPKGLASIERNTNGPSRLTGNFFKWISKIHDKITYHNTRQEARATIARYRREREAIIREGEKEQARQEFYN